MHVGVNTVSLEELKLLLPIIVPLLVIQLALAIVAVVKIMKQKEFRFFNKVSWLLIVLLLQLIGPICYFVFGRSES
ncbi:PLDc N-terminal domain-containing protein [uncultured Vagococcus sp.]|uniref:PLDc N-terminal domain-containing protein n=1 Tax=uncultured Vagococcus sp. TaxID=189676 RepID=UPI0028D22517|nr:PLDc N-terminal domain-containing protein [uncultured Vagococcus sp.]